MAGAPRQLAVVETAAGSPWHSTSCAGHQIKPATGPDAPARARPATVPRCPRPCLPPPCGRCGRVAGKICGRPPPCSRACFLLCQSLPASGCGGEGHCAQRGALAPQRLQHGAAPARAHGLVTITFLAKFRSEVRWMGPRETQGSRRSLQIAISRRTGTAYLKLQRSFTYEERLKKRQQSRHKQQAGARSAAGWASDSRSRPRRALLAAPACRGAPCVAARCPGGNPMLEPISNLQEVHCPERAGPL